MVFVIIYGRDQCTNTENGNFIFSSGAKHTMKTVYSIIEKSQSLLVIDMRCGQKEASKQYDADAAKGNYTMPLMTCANDICDGRCKNKTRSLMQFVHMATAAVALVIFCLFGVPYSS